MSSRLIDTTASSAKAAVSVILVLLYGYAARKYDLLSQAGEESASRISVHVFLPCLLWNSIGPLATWSNLSQYWVIVAYSLFFQLCSWAFGLLAVKILHMPQWLIPCLIFNNATSLPLLLLNSLGDNGTLDSLGGPLEDVLNRGKVYLLINALVCNLTRFTFGPYLMSSHDGRSHAWSHHESPHSALTDAKVHLQTGTQLPAAEESTEYPEIQPYSVEAETSPLLFKAKRGSRRSLKVLGVVWHRVEGFLNPPMVGGFAAIFTGLVPHLRKAFFEKDGVLQPLAQSIANIGELYTVLQMFVLGAHLKSKKCLSGSRPPILPLVYLFVFRLAIMPVISNATVFGVRRWLGEKILRDPVLDFTMAIGPVGPPALTLAAIVEMSDADESTGTAVAKTIVISYILTPLISLSVSGTLAVVSRLYE